MSGSLNEEVVLKEVADILKKHSIPFSTIFLDISLLDEDFDQTFPQLKDYKAGIFYSLLAVGDVPATLQAKRRIPFEEIVQWLDQYVLPIAQKVASEIEYDFDEVGAKVEVASHIKDNPKLPRRYSHIIDIECRRKDELKIQEGNTVILSIAAAQRDDTSYPTIHAFVGWLVDEESGGDFGLDVVAQITSPTQEIHPHILDLIKHSLPNLEKQLRQEIKKLQATIN